MTVKVIFNEIPSPFLVDDRDVFLSQQSTANSPKRNRRSPNRNLLNMWKRVTQSLRKRERASVLPEGFELMSPAQRRRTMLMLQQQQMQQLQLQLRQ